MLRAVDSRMRRMRMRDRTIPVARGEYALPSLTSASFPGTGELVTGKAAVFCAIHQAGFGANVDERVRLGHDRCVDEAFFSAKEETTRGSNAKQIGDDRAADFRRGGLPSIRAAFCSSVGFLHRR